MKKYVFKYENTDEEYGEKTKYTDYVSFESDETDIEEFTDEARKFLLARGFSEYSVSGFGYINWKACKYGMPKYNDEYLVTTENNDYSTAARWEDDHWIGVDNDTVEAWADMPLGHLRSV